MESYLDQLDQRCRAEGLTLQEVCKAEGVPQVTLWRWRSGIHGPSERKVKALVRRIDKMVKARQGQAEGSQPKEVAG